MNRLVWYEHPDSMVAAIQREKSLKKYRRDWKLNLVECEKSTLERFVHGAGLLRLVFMGGRDNGPAMTIIGRVGLREQISHEASLR